MAGRASGEATVRQVERQDHQFVEALRVQLIEC